MDAPVSTGIEGLDHLLRGGFTPDRMYLIEGDPGTGKTTLAMQFLIEGRERGETGLHVTLSETEIELRAIADSHGWSLEGIEIFQLAAAESPRLQDQYTLYHPSEVELVETVQRILDVIERLRPSRIVFDSLSEMRLLAREPLRYRRQILALKEFLAGRSCTVLLLDDHDGAESDLQLQSLSHGVVQLEQLPFEYGRARRRLRIIKMRGVPALEGFQDFKIQRGGLRVFPQLIVASAEAPRAEPITSGLAALDRLLGGGLTWVAPPSSLAPPAAANRRSRRNSSPPSTIRCAPPCISSKNGAVHSSRDATRSGCACRRAYGRVTLRSPRSNLAKSPPANSATGYAPTSTPTARRSS